MKYKLLLTIMVAVLAGCQNRASDIGQQTMMTNQIQVIGSHNSYKLPIEPELLVMMQQRYNRRFQELEYAHPSISEQLQVDGLRNLEIDVLYDPSGGLFSNPLGINWLRDAKLNSLPFDRELEMNAAGFKVLHQPDVDFRSSCLTLKSCLSIIKQWSNEHPNHLPIAITFNTKTDSRSEVGFAKPLVFDSTAFDALDNAFVEGLGHSKILTPDDVRGDFPTLKEAVLRKGWPALAQTRGKFILVLDEGRDKRNAYLAQHPNLERRMMFTQSSINDDYAAFMIINNPINDYALIAKRVKQGFLVRTRADSATKEARNNDYRRFNAAKASGAQFITTDYYRHDPALGNTYRIKFKGNRAARCNPVTTTSIGCLDSNLTE